MSKLVTLLIAAAIASPSAAAPSNESTQRLRDAEEVLTMSVTAPDKGIPKDLLEKAECVGVFPGIAKGAFVVGGDYGHGVFTCRQSDGKMGAPAFFTIAGGSVGWQFGGEQADLVLLVMNQQGVKHMLADRFTLGAEASAVAGPVGRTAKAATDAQLHAQILSWSRSRGAFLGASLEGNVVKPDNKTTEAFYGRPLTARQILVDQDVKTPRAAEAFVRLTTEYSKRNS